MNDDESTRYLPDELETTYSLNPEIRDVLVEGRHDELFYSEFIKKMRLDSGGLTVNVYPIGERVHVDDECVISSGYDVGERGRILTFSSIIMDWECGARSGATCIADADHAYVHSDLPESDSLIVTDYSSVESYALNVNTLDKFIRVSLRRSVPSGADLYDLIVPFLVAVFCARVALHKSTFNASFDESWFKKLVTTHDAGLTMLKLAVGGSEKRPEFVALVEEWRRLQSTVIELDQRKAVRGHDIAHAIIAALKLKNHWADAGVVEGALLGCIEAVDLSEEELFIKLTKRIS